MIYRNIKYLHFQTANWRSYKNLNSVYDTIDVVAKYCIFGEK